MDRPSRPKSWSATTETRTSASGFRRRTTFRRDAMAVSLVIDVSGSMAGEKIANARSAAQSLIESLREGDLVSIYAFSDDVYEVAAPTVVEGSVRGDLIRRVAELRDLGSTNLYGGLAAGIGRMQ